MKLLKPLLTLIGALSTAVPVCAATFTVTSLADDGGPGELRAAINTAANAPGSTIQFAGGLTGTINLAGALPTISVDMTIQGPGQTLIAINGGGTCEPFNIYSGTVSISGLTIENGAEDHFGGAIINDGALMLSNCTLSGNTAGFGGAICNDNYASIANCTFSTNTSSEYGSAIYSDDINGASTLIVTSSTFTGNNTTAYGGCVASGFTNSADTATLTDCTFTNNTGAIDGGAIDNAGTASLTRCYLSGNSASESGGGVENTGNITLTNTVLFQNTSGSGGGVNNSGTATFVNCTLSGNSATYAGALFSQPGSTATVTNTIMWNDSSEIYDAGNNVTVTYSDIEEALPGDRTGDLDNDPDFVDGLHLNPGSICYEAGTATGAPTTTIDGVTRPNPPSIGAYETYLPPSISSFTPSMGQVGTTVTITGTNFLYVSGVSFNGTPAASFTVISPTQINAIVAFGTTTGTISVTNIYGTATSSSNYMVTPTPPVDHFVVSAPVSATAGSPISVTVTAKGAGGKTILGYAGTVHFTSTDGAAVLPMDATLTQGTQTFNVTLLTAGNQTISVNDTVRTSAIGSTGEIAVNPGPTTKFAFSVPTTASAGASFPFFVTALDAFGNTETGYTGTVHFTSTDPHAALPPDAMLSGGTGSFSATLETSGYKSITATDTVTSSITGTSKLINDAPQTTITSISVATVPSVNAGSAFVVTVRVYDQYGNQVTSDNVTVSITSSDPQAVLPATVTLANGEKVFTGTLKTPGPQTITAMDTSNSVTGTSNPITVNVVAVKFVVSAPTAATIGSPASVTVTAVDSVGNTATGYSGTVKITSTDTAAILPPNGSLSNGTGTFQVTFKTAGNKTVTATDTVSSKITGTSKLVTVTH